MRKILLTLLLAAAAFTPPAGAQQVRITTNVGAFDIELYPEKAPVTVANFLAYVDSGHYRQTLFHRVIANFMIQGGGFGPDYQQKPTRPPIVNESGNGLANSAGTIAMARTGRPHSATAQFFINTQDNGFLDFEMAPLQAVNTVPRARLAVRDRRTGLVSMVDCRGAPIKRDSLQKAQDDPQGDYAACLMQAILNEPNYSLDTALAACVGRVDALRQSGALAADESCADYVARRHAGLDLVYARWGYTVFGKVTRGVEVIERIAAAPTGRVGPFAKDAPLQPVMIESIERL